MTINFQIQALAKQNFQSLMALDDIALAFHHARWVSVDAEPGYPCRVSLTDAAIGERVLGLSFEHHPASSFYRACGPIFVREFATQATLAINQIPQFLRHRSLSLRAYSGDHFMLAAKVVKGSVLESAINALFGEHDLAYIHIHNAGPGCFMCAVLPVK
jgi:hypothetical protein